MNTRKRTMRVLPRRQYVALMLLGSMIGFSSVAKSYAQEIKDFTLVNVETGAAVPGFEHITSDSQVDLSLIGEQTSLGLTVQVEGTPKKVVFSVNGHENVHTERHFPYSLFGDRKGQIRGSKVAPDKKYDVTATAYFDCTPSNPQGRNVSKRLVLSFVASQKNPVPTVPTPSPTPTASTTVPKSSTPAPVFRNLPGSTSGSSADGAGTSMAPVIATWKSNMLTYGERACAMMKNSSLDAEARLGTTYYDAQWVYLQLFEYTKNSFWNDCANVAKTIYRDQYVFPNNGSIPGYWTFTQGLTQDYLRNGDDRSKDAALLIARNAAFNRDSTAPEETASYGLQREVAYAIENYLNAELLSEPRRDRLSLLINQALDHLRQQFTSDSQVRSFMFGLAAQALISYHEHTGDQRIVPALTSALDQLWNRSWDAASNSFLYVTNGPERAPAPDLNLLIAPAYLWAYEQTKEERFLQRADTIFTGGVEGAYLSNAKQFNQNYRWSFDFVSRRSKIKK